MLRIIAVGAPRPRTTRYIGAFPLKPAPLRTSSPSMHRFLARTAAVLVLGALAAGCGTHDAGPAGRALRVTVRDFKIDAPAPARAKAPRPPPPPPRHPEDRRPQPRPGHPRGARRPGTEPRAATAARR